MSNKKTQREYFQDIIAMATEVGRDDIIEFCNGRIEALNKKSENRKPTKVQKENETLKREVKNVLELTADFTTIPEVMANSEALNGLSNQKIASLLNALVSEGVAVKGTKDKKSAWCIESLQ